MQRVKKALQNVGDRRLDGFHQQGMEKAHLMIYETNPEEIAFWDKIGWYRRDELALMSID